MASTDDQEAGENLLVLQYPLVRSRVDMYRAGPRHGVGIIFGNFIEFSKIIAKPSFPVGLRH